jgi:nucleoside-diphosphate-sugar epimerase
VLASFATPLAVLNNNIMGTANLFEAIRLSKIDPVILMCSTSEVYGQVDPTNVPITEDCPLRPSSPYAASKAAQDLLGWSYFRSYGMRIIRSRMFTYINPKRSDLFATSFAQQIARIEQGLQQELVHGNLDSLRTIIDVRDAMDAYWQALVHCRPGEVYNMGGTVSLTVGEFLKLLVKESKVPIRTVQDPKLLRPADVTLQVPNIEKFTRETGWKPKYPVESSVQLLLAYWRKKAADEKRCH